MNLVVTRASDLSYRGLFSQNVELTPDLSCVDDTYSIAMTCVDGKVVSTVVC